MESAGFGRSSAVRIALTPGIAIAALMSRRVTRACGMRTQQELREDHALRAKVLGVLGLARDLRDQVGNRVVLSDELLFSHDHAFRMFSAPRIIEVRILS